jgi:hypothetical protein
MVGAVLACLYLRGGPGREMSSPRARAWSVGHELLVAAEAWPRTFSPLDTPDPSSAIAFLQAKFLWQEAACLRAVGRWEWACKHVAEGTVLTLACADYPSRWREVLGDAAPPVAWVVGARSHLSRLGGHRRQRAWAIVGSRDPSPAMASLAVEIARQAASEGMVIISGGARGVDTLAAAGCLPDHPLSLGAGEAEGATPSEPALISIRPEGIGRFDVRAGECALTLAAPDSGFSAAAAMERNALIYALADGAIAISPRWKHGGTWHGAVECLRRRLCPLWVAGDSPDGSAPDGTPRSALQLGASSARHPSSGLGGLPGGGHAASLARSPLQAGPMCATTSASSHEHVAESYPPIFPAGAEAESLRSVRALVQLGAYHWDPNPSGPWNAWSAPGVVQRSFQHSFSHP